MDRYTKQDAFAAFNRLVAAIGGRVAEDYKDVGAYRLDWNGTYGGGNIEQIINAGGGVRQPFGAERHKAREFCTMIHFTMKALALAEKRSPVAV